MTKHRTHMDEGGGNHKTIVLKTLLVGLAALLILTMALAPPAKAQLADLDREGAGFPDWYSDSTGLRLSGVEGEVDPADPTAPPETIYWAGETSLSAGGVSGDLIMGLTGYYANDVAVAGDEITGATIKVNIRGLTPGQTYTITHPYGVATHTADAQGRIVDVLEEAGCDPHVVEAGGSCNFAEALNSSIGPFLVWNPAVGPSAPDDSIGDPDVAHEVVGSPNNTNFFRIDGPNAGGPGVNQVQTNLFNITGEVDGLAAFASLKGGTFEEAQSVTLAPSNSGANVFYTTDGSDPTNSATRQQYVAGQPLNISQTSTLKFIATGAEGQSPVFTERYVITPPTALSMNASSQALAFGQSATLSGQLSANGAGVAGKPVILEQKPAGASDFSQVGGSQNTGADGSYSFSVKPDKNTAYRVSFAGEQEGFKASDASGQVNVRALVSNNTAATNLKLGQVRNVVGKVSPAQAGKVVKMTINRPGQPALVRNLTLSATSNYKFSYKPNTVGRYSVSVQFAGDADHLGGKSVAKSFRVIR